MRIFILLLLLFATVHGAIQLSNDCLDRPEACRNNEFSVADFLLCDVGDTVATEFTAQDGAAKGTGLKGVCGFIDTCVHVYPADEINNDTWTTDPTADVATAGCNKVWLFINGVGLDPADANRQYTPAEDALWATKKVACKKWMNPTTGVCQQGGGGFITILILGIVVGLGAIGAGIWFGFLKDPNNQPDWLQKLLDRSAAAKEEKDKLLNEGMYKRRVRREFNDTI
tara:strand:- start:5869 stop:6549 length:681 start_codon:yes stop_codon:yes gene_type:complete